MTPGPLLLETLARNESLISMACRGPLERSPPYSRLSASIMSQVRYSIVRIDDQNARESVASCPTTELASEIVKALVNQYPSRQYVVESRLVRSGDSSLVAGDHARFERRRRRRSRGSPIDRRRWTAIAVALLVIYPASLGPAAAIGRWLGNPTWYQTLVSLAYYPLRALQAHGPDAAGQLINWYVGLWGG